MKNEMIFKKNENRIFCTHTSCVSNPVSNMYPPHRSIPSGAMHPQQVLLLAGRGTNFCTSRLIRIMKSMIVDTTRTAVNLVRALYIARHYRIRIQFCLPLNLVLHQCQLLVIKLYMAV